MLTEVHSFLTTLLSGAVNLGSTLSGLLVFLLLLVIHLSVTKYLWNNVLMSLTTVARKCTSIWQMLGLTLLMAFVLPR